jgi:hypothetical protein
MQDESPKALHCVITSVRRATFAKALCWALLFILAGCAAPMADAYTAPSFTARVVDARSREPIAGAIVVAHWDLQSRAVLHSAKDWGNFEVREAVTDANGRFAMEGFSRLVMGVVRSELIVFKGGYRSAALPIGPWLEGRDLELAILEPDGYYGSPGQAMYHSDLSLRAKDIVRDCQWHKIPRLLQAMDQEARRIRAAQPSARAPIGLDTLQWSSGKDCKLSAPQGQVGGAVPISAPASPSLKN